MIGPVRAAMLEVQAAGGRGVAPGNMRRNPLVGLALIALVLVLGISSRCHAGALPGFLAAYAGDTLWALAAFLGWGVLMPRASTRRVGLLAMAASVAVEVSQLYHAPWIDAVRRSTPGGLVLGHGFLWSDLACYALGVGLGVLIEMVITRVLNACEKRRRRSGGVPFPRSFPAEAASVGATRLPDCRESLD